MRTDGRKLGEIEAEENKKWRTIRLPCLNTERPKLVVVKTKLAAVACARHKCRARTPEMLKGNP